MGEQCLGEESGPSWGEQHAKLYRALNDCLNRNRHAYFISADAAGCITGCNDAMAHLLGLGSDEPQGETIWHKLPDSDGARLKARLEQIPFSDDPIRLNFVTPKHIPITLECGLALMPGGDFMIIGVPARSSAEDFEVELLQLNNALVTLSRENARKTKQVEFQNSALVRTTEELKRANAALSEARTAALQAAQAKADFLSHMSHEIRTPMNGVIAMIQLLLTTDLSPQQQHYGEVAQASGRTMLALIDDILDLSKIEARMLAIESVDFDLRRTLEDLIEIWRVQARAKGLIFRSRIMPETPSLLRGDPKRLRQVLNNLAANALKFTARGEVALNVEMVSHADGRTIVRFAFSDTGIGIRPDQARTLFSPFVQADISTTRKYGGTGLGLAISKQLVEMMGGEIGLESKEGEGSTFWFTAVLGMPLETVPASTSEPASSHQPKPASERRVGSVAVSSGVTGSVPAARILIAEDNPTNQAVALAQVEKLGYQADAVASGAEAVEVLQHGRYALVLMDCEMPTMDGYEATRHIRQSSHPQVPIIALSAHSSSSDRDRCLHAGMNDFLSKPVDLQILAQVLAKWLPGADPQGAIPLPAAASEPAVAIFDSEALLDRLAGDRQLAGRILEGFLADLPSQLNKLRERLAAADGPGALLQAHALKGSAATVSAGRLSAVAWELEQAASADRLDHFGELLPQAEEEIERLKSTLEQAEWV